MNEFDDDNDSRLIVYNSDNNLQVNIDLEKFGSIRKLYLEPIDDFAIIVINEIEVHKLDNQIYRNPIFSTNSEFHENNCYFFTNKNPQIIINLFNNQVRRIVFNLFFKSIGVDALYSSIKKFNEQKIDADQIHLQYFELSERFKAIEERYAESIERKNIVLEKFEQEIFESQQKLLYQTQRCESVLNSKSWAITAPLRFFNEHIHKIIHEIRLLLNILNGKYSAIRKSGLFDIDYYLNNHPDIKNRNLNPIIHYLYHGEKEGRKPNPLFDIQHYLKQNPDIILSAENALIHFLRVGSFHGKDPNPLFSIAFYCSKYSEVAEAGLNPLYYYIAHGCKNDHNTHPLFNSVYYKSQLKEKNVGNSDPLSHFIQKGVYEGKDPHPLFSTFFYCNSHPEVAESGLNPLVHYIQIGARLRWSPHPLFDSEYYCQQFNDALKLISDPLEHYLRIGYKESINPHPLFDSDYYVNHYLKSIRCEMTPLEHYLLEGAKNGLNPCPMFDTFHYLRKNPDVGKKGINPLSHYVQIGSKEGRDPNPLFSSSYYLGNNPDAGEGDIPLLLHYIMKGSKENKSPGPLLDAGFYLKKYPDVALSEMNPLLHYLEYGIREGRVPNPTLEGFLRKPKISILVPVYNTDARFLHEMIHSVMRQIYPHWELCIVDDGSSRAEIRDILKQYADKNEKIKIKILNRNTGISNASNEAASLATGEFIGLLDHDDVLTMDALYEVVNAINCNHSEIFYSDEELIDEEGRSQGSILKPDFSPDLLFSHNYITHFMVFNRGLF